MIYTYDACTIMTCRSKLLQQTMTLDTEQSKGLFPDLKKELEFFDVSKFELLYLVVVNARCFTLY